jgi:uncharacterized protein YkwD
MCLVPLAAVAPAATAGAACDDADIRPASDNLGRVSASVACLVGVARAEHDLPPLRDSGQLRSAAQGMTDLMVERSFFSHQTPSGRTLADRVDATGYLPAADRWLLAENLAWGGGALGTPRAIVDGWLSSAEHRANILAPDYEDVGVGVTLGSPRAGDGSGATFAIDFGTRDTRPAVKVPQHVTADRTRAASQGISVAAACSRPCTLVARLFAPKRVVVATGRLRLRLGGRGSLTVRPRRQLAGRRLALVTKAAGTPVQRTTRVTLD